MALEQGDEIEPLTVTPDEYLTIRYAGASGDFNPIHVDEDFAKAVGLPGRILHGLYMMAQVARAATDAGGGPQSLRRLKVQFRVMGLPESELTVTGTVTGVADGIATLEAHCEQNGKKIIRRAEAELVVGREHDPG
jgi:acyl dehydratase